MVLRLKTIGFGCLIALLTSVDNMRSQDTPQTDPSHFGTPTLGRKTILVGRVVFPQMADPTQRIHG